MGLEDPLEEEMATQSGLLARKTVDRGARQAIIHGVTKSWTKSEQGLEGQEALGALERGQGKTLALLLTNSMTLEKLLNLVKHQWIQLCMGFMLQHSQYASLCVDIYIHSFWVDT